MDFKVLSHEHFNIHHCYDNMVPGYLIVSPVTPVPSLSALSTGAQRDLGPILAVATGAISDVIAPLKIYCALFGEEHQQVHFHIFPRTAGVTAEFLKVFPEQRDLIHGPVLLDWARSRYCPKNRHLTCLPARFQNGWSYEQRRNTRASG
jgi:diadenosine tetraphosphate (Ap4A) HIT family hydrolase